MKPNQITIDTEFKKLIRPLSKEEHKELKEASPNPEGKKQHYEVKGKFCTQPTTAEQVAAETGVSPRTVKSAGQFARSAELYRAKLSCSIARDICAGKNQARSPSIFKS